VDLGIRQVLVPRLPGVFSAQGLLLSSVKHDHVRSRLEPILELAEAAVTERFEDLRREADAGLAADGFAPADRQLRCLLELRYAGQGYELAVPVERVPLEPGDLARYRSAFDELHRRQHGHAAPDQPVEVVNYRVEAIGLVPGVSLPEPQPATEPVESAQLGERAVLFPSLGELPLPVPVYDRARLLPGHRFAGPAIVEQYDATTVVCPEQDVEVDRRGNLVVTLREVPA